MAFELASAHLGTGMSLVIIERGSFDPFEVRVAGEAAEYLAAAWEATVTEFDAAEKVPYSPDVVIRPGEGRVLVIDDDLREENDVVAALLGDGDRPLVGANEVDASELYLYALVSSTDAGRIAAIKKRSPARQAREGRRWALAHDTLELMDDDPWQLYPSFDMLIGVNGGYAVSANAFEQLFSDAERLLAEVDSWVSTVAAALPMDAAQQETLAARSRESTRVRRRLRSIFLRGHITRVDLDDVRHHVAAMGLKVDDFVGDDALVVERATVDQLLQILNEDLFLGGLTGDRFRSEGKEPMGS